MDVVWAIEQLKNGNKICHISWKNSRYIQLDMSGKIIVNDGVTIDMNEPMSTFNFIHQYGDQKGWVLFNDGENKTMSDVTATTKDFVRALYTLPDGQAIDPALVCGVVFGTTAKPTIIIQTWNNTGNITLTNNLPADATPIIAKITSDINSIRMKMYDADLSNLTYGCMKWAILQLNSGTRVAIRRSSWPDDIYLTYTSAKLFELWKDGEAVLWICKPSDLVAGDWESLVLPD